MQDADCVPAPSCCPVPCTSDVINVNELARAQQRLGTCPDNAPCPSAGGCVTHAYLCVSSRCELVFAGDKNYHPR